MEGNSPLNLTNLQPPGGRGRLRPTPRPCGSRFTAASTVTPVERLRSSGSTWRTRVAEVKIPPLFFKGRSPLFSRLEGAKPDRLPAGMSPFFGYIAPPNARRRQAAPAPGGENRTRERSARCRFRTRLILNLRTRSALPGLLLRFCGIGRTTSTAVVIDKSNLK